MDIHSDNGEEQQPPNMIPPPVAGPGLQPHTQHPMTSSHSPKTSHTRKTAT
jgi:hypothetical protein